jgi:hypothetical protein
VLLNYVREELLAKQTLPQEVIDTVKRLKIDSKAGLLQLLKDKVLELHERASATDKVY